ncbi:uncharacterized protein LOC120349576 [Nilaparvata lugens]|uniref:uncharacterized protein LOC120349576 n=1 Tax=Nilaparvata lugens TaxID=108931 RepID=UPI00193CD420|nr:uncharacterized protein LOC120349576 [Nilaparvata lugens]
MFAATAAGKLLPPYVIYKSKHLYDLWCEGGPAEALYNRTKSGWIDGNTFLDWFQRVVVPYCRRIDGKKVIIGDNLSSHLSPEVIRLCELNNIGFIFLPANSTHLTQPLDIALFAPMKKCWRKVMEQAKLKSKSNVFDKRFFPAHLKDAIHLMVGTLDKDIKAGFDKAGIQPVNRNRVLEMLPSEEDQLDEVDNEALINDSLTAFLKEMRYPEQIEPAKKRKKKLNIPPGRSVTSKDFETSEENSSEEEDEPEGMNNDSSDNSLPSLGVVEPEEHNVENEDVENEDVDDEDVDDEDVDVEDEKQIEEGNWVQVNFQYDTGVKTFIGKVIEKLSSDRFMGSFLREKPSTKMKNVHVFPDVPDITEFKKEQVSKFLKEPTSKRGRYFFTEM